MREKVSASWPLLCKLLKVMSAPAAGRNTVAAQFFASTSTPKPRALAGRSVASRLPISSDTPLSMYSTNSEVKTGLVTGAQYHGPP